MKVISGLPDWRETFTESEKVIAPEPVASILSSVGEAVLSDDPLGYVREVHLIPSEKEIEHKLH